VIALLAHQLTFDQLGIVFSVLGIVVFLAIAALNWDATE
jgi:hypothetical protein